jgi:predicted MFS family arabinose efflux permease
MGASPRDMYGRLMGIVIIGFSAAPFAGLPTGFVAERIGTALAFAINGGLVVVLMLVVFAASRSIRGLDQPANSATRS